MGWRFVRQPDGKLCLFSDIVDDFTHCNMTADEAHEVAMEKDMGLQQARAKVERGVNDEPVWGCQPRADKLSRWQEAIDTVVQIHGLPHLREELRAYFEMDPDAPENRPTPGTIHWAEKEGD